MPWLDLARGLAALLVFLSHLRGNALPDFSALADDQRTPLVGALYLLTRLGHEAVMVFFVLSGYLVGGALLRRSMAGSFDPTTYTIDRATRILLPLVPAVVFAVIVGDRVLGKPEGLWPAVGNMIGLNGLFVRTIEGNLPLWSVAYEIWFYALGGAIACIVARRGGLLLPVLLLVLSVGAFAVLNARYLVVWCLGSLVVLLEGRKGTGWLGVAGLALAVAGVAGHQASLDGRLVAPQLGTTLIPVAEAAICLGIALTLPLLAAQGSILGSRVLQWLAARLSEMSYSLYLLHYPALLAVSQLIYKSQSVSALSLTKFVIKGVLVFAICYVFYRAFEYWTPALRHLLKNRSAASRHELSPQPGQ